LSRFNAYDDARCEIAENLEDTFTTESGRYVISAADIDAGSFELEATPQDAQADDDAGCGTLSLNQSGQREVSGSKPVAQCWDR
jgi:Tfp pilus assembly protein PilE